MENEKQNVDCLMPLCVYLLFDEAERTTFESARCDRALAATHCGTYLISMSDWKQNVLMFKHVQTL